MSASPAAAAITLKSPRLLILLLSTLVVGMGQTVVFAIIPMLGRKLFADADLGITLGSIAFRPPLELAVNASATLTVGPEEQGGIAGLLAAAPGMGFVIGALLGGVVYSVDP